MLGLSSPLMPAKPALPDYSAGAGPVEHRFNPYSNNHGSVVAIGGSDYVVIASDTRLPSGYSIMSRTQSKLFPLGEGGRSVLGSSGCWADILTLTRLLETRAKMYWHEHAKPMSTGALAQMLATILYSKRFFPYYTHNILAGLDENGEGVVYSYDPVGCVEKFKFGAAGTACSLLQPMLDNQVGKMNLAHGNPEAQMDMEEALNLIHDLFVSATEREINTGDSIHFKIVTKNGIEERTIGLRKD
ncbi:hypothetical protein TCAL_05286 [Tigriopus californicus]|uniref:Proteasome subunit beta n=1 Tax=Tigriopus californicus TaxID=6832 RepID=A0A553NZQ4_TIGCA|nr:proteasome subunit beta type-1-like [Tigriopus californicus]TRY70907.1 hypothetical protein TCAL_05286 [Tigriopus californicus]|eukprot:TCALIF_05286-PA protein Name:"Similar to Prosbeta6 Proteasome subunit beta type-1 (Drosophila melanogaster)" AED:0.20 eAED:0.20 QI:0/0/0/1/1/1/2/0/243